MCDKAPIDLIINPNHLGAAQGKLFLNEGHTQAEIDNKLYEYYEFRLSKGTLSRWNLNENNKSSRKGLNKIYITNSENLNNTDFACMSGVDGSLSSLGYTYNATLKTLILYRTDEAEMNLTEMRSIHFGNSSSHLNLCNPQSQYYRFESIPDLNSTFVTANVSSLAPNA